MIVKINLNEEDMATNTTFDRILRGVVNAVQFDAAVTAQDLTSWGLNEAQTKKILALIQGARLDEYSDAPAQVADLKGRLIAALDMAAVHSLAELPLEGCLWPDLSFDATLKVIPFMTRRSVVVCALACKQWNQFFNSPDITPLLAFWHFSCKDLAHSVGHSVRTLEPFPNREAMGSFLVRGENLILSMLDKDSGIKICNWKENTCRTIPQKLCLQKNPFAAIPDQKLFLLGSKSYEKLDVLDWNTLDVLATLDPRLPRKEGRAIHSLALSGGKLCLSFDRNKKVQVWNVDGGYKRVAQLEATDFDVISLFAHGNKLITTSSYFSYQIWDLDSYQSIAKLEGKVGEKCLYAQGANLFFAGSDETLGTWSHEPVAGPIRIFDTDKLEWKPELKDHKYRILALAGQGNDLFSSCSNGEVRRWDLQTMKCTRVFKCKLAVDAMTFVNQQLFLVSKYTKVDIWDFDISLRQVLEEIVRDVEKDLFSGKPEEAELRVIQRFQALPDCKAKEKILQKLGEVLNIDPEAKKEILKKVDPKMREDFWEQCMEDAFSNPWEPNHVPRRGLQITATAEQKIEAIKRCLNS
jgi:WD40 repeat protein